MIELTYIDEGDLESIVRGSGSGSGDTFSGENSGGFSPSFCLPIETSSFYEPEMETTGVDELGELYKPFYPFPTQTILTSFVTVPEDSRSLREDKKQRSGFHISNGSRVDHIRIPESKSKKSKKNQQKRVVEQVNEENLLSDAWAWRKYGQKPIKGSPYPRSYYRCSSLKGCLARKQVERNPQTPEIFTITYTNEHNHELPTRRNSLAGSTRAKSSQTKHIKEVVSSPSSNLLITSVDESTAAVQDMTVTEVSTYQTSGETYGMYNNLPPDLMSGTGTFPIFTGDFDELLLSNQEFINGYLWN